MRGLIVYFGLAGLLVFISGLIPRRLKGADLPEDTYSICEKFGEDVVVGAGWPFAFIYDGNVTSPVCSTAWTQLWLFEDGFLPAQLALTIGLSLVLSAVILFGVRRGRTYRGQ